MPVAHARCWSAASRILIRTRLTENVQPARGGVTAPLPRREWAFVGAILAAFLVGTAYVAWAELRPPFRAMRGEWKYQYGFHDVEPGSDLRWTDGRAVDVFPIDACWMLAPWIASSPI